MADEHVIVVAQPTFKTYVTPTKAFPVRTASHQMAKEFIEERLTGSGRALARIYEGIKKPAGSLDMLLFSDEMGVFFKAAGMGVTTSTPVGALTARRHCFLMADIFTFLSMQIKRNATIATNLRSVAVNDITLTLNPNQNATIAASLLIEDEAAAGGTFENGDASAAVIATPAYITSTLIPFKWSHATLEIGGTPAIDAGVTDEITVSGATTISNAQSIEIKFENTGEHKHYIGGDASAGRIAIRDFNISVKMDIDHDTLVTTYYDYVRNGSQVPVRLSFIGEEIEVGHNYEFAITVPAVQMSEADYADAMGSQDDRVQRVSGLGVEDSVTGEPIGVTIIDSQTGY